VADNSHTTNLSRRAALTGATGGTCLSTGHRGPLYRSQAPAPTPAFSPCARSGAQWPAESDAKKLNYPSP
jgi:hypothetical protein